MAGSGTGSLPGMDFLKGCRRIFYNPGRPCTFFNGFCLVILYVRLPIHRKKVNTVFTVFFAEKDCIFKPNMWAYVESFPLNHRGMSGN